MNTCTVTLPEYEVAAAAMIRLCLPASLIAHDPNHPKRFVYRGVWRALRQAAEQITMRRALCLNRHEKDLLDAALDFCAPGGDRDYINSLTFEVRS